MLEAFLFLIRKTLHCIHPYQLHAGEYSRVLTIHTYIYMYPSRVSCIPCKAWELCYARAMTYAIIIKPHPLSLLPRTLSSKRSAQAPRHGLLVHTCSHSTLFTHRTQGLSRVDTLPPPQTGPGTPDYASNLATAPLQDCNV